MLGRSSLAQEVAIVKCIPRTLPRCRAYKRRMSSSTNTDSSSSSHLTSSASKLNGKYSACVVSFLAGAVGSLGLTYYIWSSSKERNTNKVKFGTALHFQTAVRILCMTFPEEGRVTTEPDDLYDHGVSENDYHPGT